MSDTPDRHAPEPDTPEHGTPARDTPDAGGTREAELPSDPDAPGTYLDDETSPDVAEPNEPA